MTGPPTIFAMLSLLLLLNLLLHSRLRQMRNGRDGVDLLRSRASMSSIVKAGVSSGREEQVEVGNLLMPTRRLMILGAVRCQGSFRGSVPQVIPL